MEIIAVYFKNYTEHINTLCGQNVELYLLHVLYSVVLSLQRDQYSDLSF